MSTRTAPTAQLDRQAVTRWFVETVPGVVPPLRFERITGGRSNLTFAVTDAGAGRWVLRRPPLGAVTGNAHNVVREADVLGRLGGTAVPVPPVLGVCDDSSVTDAPFFVMEHLDGTVLRGAADVVEHTDPGQRSVIAHALIDVLVRLHRVDLSAIGWADRAGRRGFVERQLDRWTRNWQADRVRVLGDIDIARGILQRRIPQQRTAALVHGDYRLDNCLLGADLSVTGVLDWELATVGDPLADLGQFLVYWAQPDDTVTALDDPPTGVAGFPSRAVLIARYREGMRGVLDLDEAEIDYYVAFSWFKTACIVENVFARMDRGAMGAADRSPQSFAAQAERLAEQARRCAEGLA